MSRSALFLVVMCAIPSTGCSHTVLADAAAVASGVSKIVRAWNVWPR
jgi:hypothetical protein